MRPSYRALIVVCFAAIAALFSVFMAGPSESGERTAIGPDPRQHEKTVSKGIAFLLSAQAADGSWSRQSGPAVTALAASALMRHGRTPSDPAVAKALKYLEGFVQPTGGIHHPESMYRNYETCLAVMCFQAANGDGRYSKELKRAEKFLKELQWDEGEGHDRSSFHHGGQGYGKHRRPDLSNTQFFLDTLRELGNGPEDQHVQKALLFVSRCQNLETEHNTTPFSAKVGDGGFYYTPADGGTSQADEGRLPGGGLRSYASMTYAGLKSMIYAGVKPDDPRVKAAVQWISKNYDLKSNPGLGDAGLYYYYHTFAKALHALGHDTFRDARGKKHDWRQELTEELARRQQADGSWVNENKRWLEGDAQLTTAYSLLALSYCRR
jgi:squalene-hopene/tetraprenyl-beta-curcumene cyclase